MLAAPETEEVAGCFYKRLEKNGVRWVSYHFKKAAERVEPDSAVIKIISEVEEDNGQQWAWEITDGSGDGR